MHSSIRARRRAHRILTAVAAASFAAPLAADVLPPAAHQRLAREIFQQLIEIDTTPTYGSTPAAEALAARFRAAGFPEADVQVVGPKPIKQNVVVRYRGSGKRKPVLVIGHLDVVEAARDAWTVDPFKLTEKDGYFYGRGTSDMKDKVAAVAANLLRLKSEGYVPDRDLIVAFTADEEIGDDNGPEWLLNNRGDLIDAEFVVNAESGRADMQNGRRTQLQIQTSEKIYATYQLTVNHRGGHSSVPERDNAIYRLAEGLGRLARHDFPMRLDETRRAFFENAAPRTEGQRGADMLAILRSPPDAEAVRRLTEVPHLNARMRTTCVATMLQAGHQENALPVRAQATVQCRLLPDEALEAVPQMLADVVADPQIEVSVTYAPHAAPASPVSPEITKTVGRIVKKMWPGVAVFPSMGVGASDNIYFRRAGIPTYGINGMFGDVDDVRAHGRDERIGVQQFYEGVEFNYRLLKALTGGK